MAMGKNRYQKDIEKQKNGGSVIQKVQPMDDPEDVNVDFDPEEIEAKAAKAVSSMQPAPSADAPTEKIEPVDAAATDERQKAARENLKNTVPKVNDESDEPDKAADESQAKKPEPEAEEEAPKKKKKARPQQDPESKPMQGIVSEFFSMTPERLAQVQTAGQPAVSQELRQEFLEGKFDDMFLDDLGRAFASATVHLRLEAEARKEALAKEAAKWKTALVVKDKNGKMKSLPLIYDEACQTIDSLPLGDETKAEMKKQAFADRYVVAEAWQRHCETGEFRRYESAELAALKKEEWRAGWDAEQAKKAKKNNPAGKPAK